MVVKNDYKNSLILCEKLFFEFISEEKKKNLEKLKQNTQNFHRCLRTENCECIFYGKLLIDIQMNLNQQKNIDLIKILEKYFFFPNITLPYELFKYLCVTIYKKQMNIQLAKILIENYLTYSKIKKKSNNFIVFGSQNSNQENNQTIYEINKENYEELNEILIFDLILVENGFSRTKAKINQIPEENLRIKFNKKYEEIIKKYEINEKNEIIKENSEEKNFKSKIITYIEKYINKIMIKFGIYSNFQLENYFLGRICIFLLNKKFIIISLIILIIYFIKRILKRFELDTKIKTQLKIILYFLSRNKIIQSFSSLISGMLSLLINY